MPSKPVLTLLLGLSAIASMLFGKYLIIVALDDYFKTKFGQPNAPFSATTIGAAALGITFFAGGWYLASHVKVLVRRVYPDEQAETATAAAADSSITPLSTTEPT